MVSGGDARKSYLQLAQEVVVGPRGVPHALDLRRGRGGEAETIGESVSVCVRGHRESALTLARDCTRGRRALEEGSFESAVEEEGMDGRVGNEGGTCSRVSLSHSMR